MREIKFKAWDTKKKKFDYDVMILRGEACYIDSFDALEFYKEGRMIILQYTGIDDICEGDIIEHMDSISLELLRSEVYWSDRGYWAVRDKGKEFVDLLHRTEIPKIIGNIYANPELLEVTP